MSENPDRCPVCDGPMSNWESTGYDKDYVFELIRSAYERGYRWGQENPDSHPFLNKAAYDYADKTLGPDENET